MVLALGACTTRAGAISDGELAGRLQARFDHDRSGVCVVAAVIDTPQDAAAEPPQPARAQVCATPRPGGGPGLDAAFEIGSITKTMTAFLVAELVQSGRWSLDDPIARHLPPGSAVPVQGQRQILVRDVVTHSSGLPALPARMLAAGADTDPANPYAGLTQDGLLDSLAQAPLAGPIGSPSGYSNFAMMVLSLAVARAHGGDLEDALRSHLFQPLQMQGAYLQRRPAGVRAAQGHTPGGAATPAWTWDAAPALAGMGGVRARLDDLLRYAQAELGLVDTPLAAALRATQQPLAPGWGMNWALASTPGHDWVLHEGGTGGFSALLLLEPARRRAVVMLADTALTDLGGLAATGLALLEPQLPMPRPRLAQALPPCLLAAAVGQYTLAGRAMRLWNEGGHLMAQAAGQSAFELLHDDHGDLYPAGFNALLRPLPDHGRLMRFAWHQGGGVAEGLRTGSAPLPTSTPPDPLLPAAIEDGCLSAGSRP